jgi:hypothetical protein
MGLGRWAGTLAALTLGGGWLAFGQPGTPPTMVEAAQPSTPLEIEIVGGFAIVQADPRLDIAYLNDTLINLSDTRRLKTGESDKVVCNVRQVGTQLEIVRGNIISAMPANAPELPSKIFDLDEKEVTFQALEAGAVGSGSGPVHTWPPVPSLPTPSSNATQWQTLSFIPGLTKRHTGTGPAPNWFTKLNAAGSKIVNGRIRLRGGSIIGGVPSRPQMQESHFEFRERSNTVPPFKAAVTDRAVYSATVVGNNVVIEFSAGGNSPIRRLEVAPLVAGEPVKLRVRGNHNGMGPEPGGKLGDFCAFYSLFNDIPDHEQWLEPFLIQAAGGGGGGLGPQPTPGFYCPMDWF